MMRYDDDDQRWMGNSGTAASRFAEEGTAANGSSSTHFTTGGTSYFTSGNSTHSDDSRPSAAGARVDSTGAIIGQTDGTAALLAMHKNGAADGLCHV